MILTRNFILENRTKTGGYTRAQIESLGIDYPTSKGWIGRLVGSEISEQNKEKFIKSKRIFSKTNKKATKPNSEILALEVEINRLNKIIKLMSENLK